MSDDKPRGSPSDEQYEGDELVITKYKPRTEKPPLYKVLLLNDDFSPMDFVILILKKFFTKSEAEATRIMMQVHNDGAGLAGIYTFEVAETKVYAVNEFSRRQKHPLKCIMEKE
jgi:ATP-dependent Clp protease adaptor protein ClpS